jgi:hypothetical protein
VDGTPVKEKAVRADVHLIVWRQNPIVQTGGGSLGSDWRRMQNHYCDDSKMGQRCEHRSESMNSEKLDVLII